MVQSRHSMLPKMLNPDPQWCMVTRLDGDSDTQPCEGAEKFLVLHIDRRSSGDPKKIPCFAEDANGWWDFGTNHRIENGGIVRDLDWKPAWFIKTPDLWKFVQEQGDCVVGFADEGYRWITIFNNLRGPRRATAEHATLGQ